jgi:hypothetical protein
VEVPAGWTITLLVNFDYAAASIAHFTIIERYRACLRCLRYVSIAGLSRALDRSEMVSKRTLPAR